MIKQSPGDHHLVALTVKVFDPEGAYSAFDSRLTRRNLIDLFHGHWIGHQMPLGLRLWNFGGIRRMGFLESQELPAALFQTEVARFSVRHAWPYQEAG